MLERAEMMRASAYGRWIIENASWRRDAFIKPRRNINEAWCRGIISEYINRNAISSLPAIVIAAIPL